MSIWHMMERIGTGCRGLRVGSGGIYSKKPGTYLLCFQAYDESGAVIGQSFCGYSTEEPYINIGNIQAES